MDSSNDTYESRESQLSEYEDITEPDLYSVCSDLTESEIYDAPLSPPLPPPLFTENLVYKDNTEADVYSACSSMTESGIYDAPRSPPLPPPPVTENSVYKDNTETDVFSVCSFDLDETDSEPYVDPPSACLPPLPSPPVTRKPRPAKPKKQKHEPAVTKDDVKLKHLQNQIKHHLAQLYHLQQPEKPPVSPCPSPPEVPEGYQFSESSEETNVAGDSKAWFGKTFGRLKRQRSIQQHHQQLKIQQHLHQLHTLLQQHQQQQTQILTELAERLSGQTEDDDSDDYHDVDLTPKNELTVSEPMPVSFQGGDSTITNYTTAATVNIGAKSTATIKTDNVNQTFKVKNVQRQKLQDQCPVNRGYTMNNLLRICFKIHNTRKTHDFAVRTCRREGGDGLLRIDNVMKQNFFVKNYDPKFTGFVDGQLVKEKWIFSNGDPMLYLPFRAGEPSGSGHCLQRGIGWNDVPCTASMKFTCEKRV